MIYECAGKIISKLDKKGAKEYILQKHTSAIA